MKEDTRGAVAPGQVGTSIKDIMKNPFRLPAPADIAAKHLEHAERELLRHLVEVESHSASVAMYNARITRLKGTLATAAPVMLKGVRRAD